MINTNVCEMHVQIVRCYVKYLQIHNWCTCTLNYIQLFTYALKTYASNLVETALRFNLRVSYFQNFLEGHVPRPPRRLVLCTAECTSHTRLHQYPMAMQFHIWPIKFSFDWPFRPSNKLLLYCTLYICTFIWLKSHLSLCLSTYILFDVHQLSCQPPHTLIQK